MLYFRYKLLIIYLEREIIDKGEVNIKVYFKVNNIWVPMPNLGRELCSIVDCPIERGKKTVHKSFNIPNSVPKGEYKGIINMSDQNKKLLICINFQLELK